MVRSVAARVADVLAIFVLSACSLVDSGNRTVRVALNLSALTKAQENVSSVMDHVDLVVTDQGGEYQETASLLPGEFDPTLEVEVERGEAMFAVEVKNAQGTTLYRGQETATIDADGFSITIVPTAVSPVMVVAPRQLTYSTVTSQQQKGLVYQIGVRNSGTDSLLWRLDRDVVVPTGYSLTCRFVVKDGNCFVNRAVGANQTEFIQVILTGSLGAPEPPDINLRFLSDNSGTLTVSSQ